VDGDRCEPGIEVQHDVAARCFDTHLVVLRCVDLHGGGLGHHGLLVVVVVACCSRARTRSASGPVGTIWRNFSNSAAAPAGSCFPWSSTIPLKKWASGKDG